MPVRPWDRGRRLVAGRPQSGNHEPWDARISLHSAGSRIGVVGEKMHIEAGKRHAAGAVEPAGECGYVKGST